MKHQFGASLIMSLGFTLALLFGVGTVAKSITQSLEQARNVEDYTIAFYAAEAGIEEALYEYFTHSNGYSVSDKKSILFTPNIQNTYNIDGQIDEDECKFNAIKDNDISNMPIQCKTSLSFGSSTTLRFDYTDALETLIQKNLQSNYIHFDFNEQVAAKREDSVIALSWVANYFIDRNEYVLFPMHNSKISTFGYQGAGLNNDEKDCVENTDLSSKYDGKYICELSVDGKSSFTLQIQDPWQGGSEVSSTDFDYIVGINKFFDTQEPKLSTQKQRTLKWFYVNPLYDTDGHPIDTIQIAIAPQHTMTAPITVITSRGLSKTIERQIEVKLNTTKDSITLDYSVLLD